MQVNLGGSTAVPKKKVLKSLSFQHWPRVVSIDIVVFHLLDFKESPKPGVGAFLCPPISF